MKANRFDRIYIGRRRGDELIYAGKVDHGFTPDDGIELQDRLKPLIRKSQPYKKRIAHKDVWVEPTVLAEIEYRAKSAEGQTAASILQGIARRLGLTTS
jgi:bifunctional non-homologous end joining protein LigD